MTRWTNRRAVVGLAGSALAATLLLTGCSAGQIAETARKSPSVPGANAQAQLRNAAGEVIGSVAVRDVAVAYDGVEGYQAGADAPLRVSVFNDTTEQVSVEVAVGSPPADGSQIVQAESVRLVGGEDAGDPSPEPTGDAEPTGEAEPTGSAEPTGEAEPTGTAEGAGSPEAAASPDDEGPATPAGGPARLDIPAGGFVALNPDGARYLTLTGLGDRLTAGMSVPLTFRFSNGLVLNVLAPVTTPLEPAPRATPHGEDAEGGH